MKRKRVAGSKGRSIGVWVVAVVVTLIPLGSELSAAPIASSDFEDNATGSISGQGGGMGWTNTWNVNADITAAQVVNANLTYANGEVASDGGSHALEVIPGIDLSPAFKRLFTTQTGNVYMSFLWRDSVNDESPTASTDFTQVGFDPATDDGNPNLSFLRDDGNLSIRSGSTGESDSGVDGNIGTTYMIVIQATRVDGANYTANLWVNPSSLTEGAPDATSDDTGIDNIGTFLVRTAFHEADDAFQIDNILIGTNWSDVVTSTAKISPADPSVASNAAPGTLVAQLGVDGSTGVFTYAIEAGGDNSYFDIPEGTTNLLRTAAWLDNDTFTISIVATEQGGDLLVLTNSITVTATPAAPLFVVDAEVGATVTEGQTVGTAVMSSDVGGASFSLVAGNTNLFTFSGAELQVLNADDWGGAGTTNYVTIRAVGGSWTNDLIVSASVVNGTPTGSVFSFR